MLLDVLEWRKVDVFKGVDQFHEFVVLKERRCVEIWGLNLSPDWVQVLGCPEVRLNKAFCWNTVIKHVAKLLFFLETFSEVAKIGVGYFLEELPDFSRFCIVRPCFLKSKDQIRLRLYLGRDFVDVRANRLVHGLNIVTNNDLLHNWILQEELVVDDLVDRNLLVGDPKAFTDILSKDEHESSRKHYLNKIEQYDEEYAKQQLKAIEAVLVFFVWLVSIWLKFVIHVEGHEVLEIERLFERL